MHYLLYIYSRSSPSKLYLELNLSSYSFVFFFSLSSYFSSSAAACHNEVQLKQNGLLHHQTLERLPRASLLLQRIIAKSRMAGESSSLVPLPRVTTLSPLRCQWCTHRQESLLFRFYTLRRCNVLLYDDCNEISRLLPCPN